MADLRSWASRRWRHSWPDWLAEEPSRAAEWPLHPPTERELVQDPDAVAAKVSAWARLEASGQVDVEWVERRTRGFGRQRLPARALLTPAQVAEAAGEAALWRRAVQAADLLRSAWPGTDLAPALRVAARRLAAMPDEDVVALVAVLGWLEANPSSGLWERELPVVGVDSKWAERHRVVVDALHDAVAGGAPGLRRPGISFRVRLLDPGHGDGAGEFAVDLAGLGALRLAPSAVIIVENLTSLLTLPPLPGAVGVHGMGFSAPSLASVQWIRDAPQVWYWGDLDTYGLLILGQVRAALPGVRSVLMNTATLGANRRWVGVEPRPYRGEISHLTADEHRALAFLRDGDLRLEQERIPRPAAAAALVGLGVGNP